MPRFSIVIPHYQGAIPHEILCRGIDSLKKQTFQDFEILLYHRGPLLDRSLQMPVPIMESEPHENDWGHTLRDRGIREAKGDYILHFNPDNILYPNALETIDKESRRPGRIIDGNTGRVMDTDNIIVFPILMRGHQKIFEYLVRDPGKSDWYIILTGNPPKPSMIDAMQLVMKRDLWLAEGGWYDKRQDSDGFMYEKFAFKYGYRAVGPVLGEHF